MNNQENTPYKVSVYGTAIIVPMKTGVIVTNQTSGLACHHPIVEGFIIPIENLALSRELVDYFEHAGWGNLSSEEIEFLEQVLRRYPETKNIFINKEMLADSEEAWVHVIMKDDDKNVWFPDYAGFDNHKAILTWENSD